MRKIMSEFKVIETQEAFDAAISARLKRDREKYAEQFEAELKDKGWKSPEDIAALTADLTKQIETLQTAAASTEKLMADKDAKIAEGERYRTDLAKTRIALNAGLSIDQVGRLQGSNEEEWTADAQKLMGEFTAYAEKAVNTPSPLGTAGSSAGKDTRTQFADFASALLNH
jgi:hypothetical protein